MTSSDPVADIRAISARMDILDKLERDILLLPGNLTTGPHLEESEVVAVRAITDEIMIRGLKVSDIKRLKDVLTKALRDRADEWKGSETGRFVQQVFEVHEAEKAVEAIAEPIPEPVSPPAPRARRGSIKGSIPGLLSERGAMSVTDVQTALGTGYNGTKKALYTLEKEGIIRSVVREGNRKVYTLAPKGATA
ncbi:MAG: hypothetical protein Q4Q62_05315 [Thermoplasmata archaeon]|nr:hypothetical protein [Thermoplasmata archaeon]